MHDDCACRPDVRCLDDDGSRRRRPHGHGADVHGLRRVHRGGQYIVTVALAVFAFTTILGWSYCGERCWQYLFSERSLYV
ncbi:MAG: sodium:alanine symporter family protein [Boseongicola sp. SB0673_bin_14]|nr:sodium:alanine symporter family protein [Boseongicola sp. SB0667_bin_21]MYI69648.1 sodium:alanine symporter family protein [Boseongicola sp. SB0673_bin_14]